ncbi:MAG: hypothetical protein CMD23_04775 [Flavobacteriales bacterium]|nr:hypothetical protein [Flavobacteriales bacterium]|tara:strand:- start:36 stop:647 length:612 start_codon:yes stop_codon:yes gene_type:complete
MTTIFSCNEKSNIKLIEGDLLFQDLDSSPLCDGIEKVTSGVNNLNFSHIGIVTITNNQHYVLEAFTNGVDTVSLKDFLNRSVNDSKKPKVVVGRVKTTYSHLISKAINAGYKLLGKQYDEEFKIDNDKLYCSELIYEIFYQANNNQDFFYLEPMTYKFNDETLPIWNEYFHNLNISIPEGEPGINPGGISLSDKINIIANYQD